MTRAAWSSLGLTLLLALFGLRLMHAAQQNAFTLDEPHYVGTGLYLWETGDYHFFRALRFQQPLAFHLASVPLLFLDLPEVALTPDIGTRLIAASGPGLPALRVASRLPFVLLSIWGAWLAFVWARQVGGPQAGLLAAFLFTMCPSLLAHGALAHSDMPVAVLTLQTLYLFWRWWCRPGAIVLVACGVSLGLALLAKLSALLLFGSVGLLALLAFAPGRPAHDNLPVRGVGSVGARLLQSSRVGSVLVAVALAVVWLGYGGSFAFAEAGDGAFAGVPLPAFLHSFLFVDRVNATGRPVFFFGEFSTRGWWFFYPVAFAIKEPVGFVLLCLGGVASLYWRRQRLGLFLAVPLGIYLVILLFWVQVPLGYRYALPILPLLCVLAATQLAPLPRGAARVAVLSGLALLAIESVRVHPHYLAHFSAAVGGPERGHRYLLDANLDWGQGVTALARELAARGNPPVRLALYAAEDPRAYGVKGAPYTGCEPVGGWFALSANVRMGLYRAGDPFAPPLPDCYDWLDEHEPVAMPCGSIFLYELPEPATRGSQAPATPGGSRD